MVRADRAKRIDPARADSYAEVGRRLLLAGRAILDGGDQRHASALAILSIHAVIAYTDAVCVHLGGTKSTSSDHEAAATLLRRTMGGKLPPVMATMLTRVLSAKDRFEYQGYVASMRDAQSLFDKGEKFGTWAESVLTGMRRTGQ